MLLIATPLVAVACGAASHYLGGLEPAAAITLGVAFWTAVWWVFEVLPLPVTSLLPIALLPLLGVLDSKQVAQAYGHPLVLLLLGGFLLSQALECSGAHRRIALGMVRACSRVGGGGERAVLMGFMLASASLSMWISNTATTLMMLPVAVAAMEGADRRLRVPLLLGIAYAANVGGIGTPIGTPPNLVFMAEYEKASGEAMTFVGWMKTGVPVTVVMVLCIWLWLGRKLKSEPLPQPESSGAWRPAERRTLLVFAVTALLWITRTAPFGGWKAWLNLPNANDASVAMLAVVALFCIPSGQRDGKRLLDWKSANRVPWGLLILVAAGLCLGSAFKESGLSETIAKSLEGLNNVPTPMLILAIAFLVTFLTEMTSNTATTNLLMPILAAAAASNNLDPAILMLPAAVSASCAFMLPAATMPNAVVFATGDLTVGRMAREGLALNLIGALVVSLICYLTVA